MMDVQQGVAALMGLLAGGGLSALGARWWFGRRLRAAAARQDKVDKAREFAAQQASQARRQIETLQKELGELRLQHQQLQQQWQRQQRPAAGAPAPQGSAELPILGVAPTPPQPAGDGFADTQLILPRRP